MPSLRANVIIDTSVLVALLCSKDAAHQACLDTLRKLPESTCFFTTESCLVETAYVLPGELSFSRNIALLLEGLDVGLVALDRQGLLRVCELMTKYEDLPMDFADASLVVACEAMEIKRVFTLDRRDFSIYKPRHCSRFELLPA